MSNIDDNNITDNMLLHGHITKEEIPMTDALVDYMVELYKICNDKHTMCKPSRYSLNVVKGDAKEFFHSLGIDIQNVGVYTDEDLISRINNKCVRDLNELVHIYNTNVNYISPFDIPIVLEDTHCFMSKTVEQSAILDEIKNDRSLLENLYIFFKSIHLPKTTGEIATADYIHEITHTQLEDEKGIVRDYYNSEVLSIFNELLYAYSVSDGLLNVMLTNRINNTFTSFTRLYQKKSDIELYLKFKNEGKAIELDRRIEEDYKYVISTIKALKLFSMYVVNSSDLGKNIIEQMNNVFSGIQSLESMLDNLNISVDNSINTKYVRSLYKKFDNN